MRPARALMLMAGALGCAWLVVASGCEGQSRRETVAIESAREYEVIGPEGQVGTSPGEPIVEPDAEVLTPAPRPPPGPEARERAAIRYRDSEREADIRVYEDQPRSTLRREVIVEEHVHDVDVDDDEDCDDDTDDDD